MSKTLYLLRQPVEQVNRAMFLSSETDGDVVLFGEAASSELSLSQGHVFSIEKNGRHPLISYDSLIEKLFQSEHVIVI
jgi:hypothetical protein